ncbi:hypothetical protein TheveDRAFT_0201 [Thermanaerovibrio velox DSM 12556]|uniref:HD domain-containing protein n=1 Tax=Thermanaerovibrio velox DSM 12556 TaxID=926567 RepID=H0UNH8_9BACT|nr:HD domain-containing protein [Thermanaerovibrio velox]EHM09385.1 hypothetical protein TheveDRAFT_0201 [Thermanaerovibrio velox DSM 12556]
MISFDLLETLFGAFSMERWNDHPRPMGLFEMDKQGHKAVIALLMARMEGELNAAYLAMGLVFQFLKRVVLTDLKPPVYHRIVGIGGDRVDQWVASQWEVGLAEIAPELPGLFRDHLAGEGDMRLTRILEAANAVATGWEHFLMEPLAKDLYGFKRTRREVLERLGSHRDVPLVQEFLFKLSGSHASPLCDFVDLTAQLRFQKRWTRVPRIPETSVLGHMFFVALMGFFLSALCGLPRERWGWNFFGGLLHDLPEALTRDVISPLKRQMGLQDLLAQVEREMMEDQVYPLLPEPLGPLVKFLVEDEFSLRAMEGDRAFLLESLEEADRISAMGLPVVDGPLLDLADKYSAFLEAEFSMYYGVSNRVLQEASSAIRGRYCSVEYNGVKLSGLFDLMSRHPSIG